MREYLFRGKRIDNGQWIYGYYIKAIHHWHNHGVHEDWIATDTVQNGGWCNVRGKYAVSPETIGQYTGLTDKNGKKIFEGDIIQTTRKGLKGEKTFRFVIKYGAYIPEEYCKEIYNQAEVIGFYAFDGERDFQISNYPKMLEVIGNIHDNPELLGGAG